MKLESHLRAQRSAGRKLLVPYMTGGLRDDWLDLVRAMADAGADAIEIGLPFSDPMIDGPTIQEASQIALERGTTPVTVLQELRDADIGVPLVVMTYYNIAFAAGHERFAGQLAEAGVDGVILPDLPLEECTDWRRAADAAGVENVLLAAPTSPDARLGAICEATRGFVYAVGTVGVTGERAALASTALANAARLKAVTDKPVIVGIGVSTPEQAAEVCTVADGAVVASAILRRLLDGHDGEDMYRFVASLRAALDGMNLVGHLVVAARAGFPPPTQLGAVLPDALHLIGLRTPPDLPGHLGAGVSLHHRTDEVFHRDPEVVAAMARLRDRLTDLGVARAPARAMAHIGYEMVLDGVLVGFGWADDWPQAWASAHEVTAALPSVGHGDWADLQGHTSTMAWPRRYQNPEWVAERVVAIVNRRPRLATEIEPARLASVFEPPSPRVARVLVGRVVEGATPGGPGRVIAPPRP